MMSISSIRNQFPILNRKIHGKPLVYFDNAATVQKPQSVLDALTTYYEKYNANVHRGVHTLSMEATEAMESVRGAFQVHLNAVSKHEIIFTQGTTEGINLVASGFSQLLQKGDEVIISHLEHHSNIVPWQMACQKSGAVLRIIPINKQGEIQLEAFKSIISTKTKVVAINHISNTLGTINPIKEIIDISHTYGAAVLIDGAQSIAHLSVDVQELNCDFYCFSAHKMYGPTGVGILYGKEVWLEKIPPYQGGGEMIDQVTFAKTTYAPLPFKFEAGTPNIADIIAMQKGLEFIQDVGIEVIAQHENDLLVYATEKLNAIEGLQIIGRANQKSAVISFVVAGIHPFDIGSILDKMGIAVRTGHHCTQPLMDFYQIPGTVRASFAVYNTKEEVTYFIQSLERTLQMLR